MAVSFTIQPIPANSTLQRKARVSSITLGYRQYLLCQGLDFESSASTNFTTPANLPVSISQLCSGKVYFALNAEVSPAEALAGRSATTSRLVLEQSEGMTHGSPNIYHYPYETRNLSDCQPFLVFQAVVGSLGWCDILPK